jgi:hypothetical protein
MPIQQLVLTVVDGPSSVKVQNSDVGGFPIGDLKGHDAPPGRWLSPYGDYTSGHSSVVKRSERQVVSYPAVSPKGTTRVGNKSKGPAEVAAHRAFY